MPAGCDFVCKNDDCDYYDTGFTITGPWPMGEIDEILESKSVKELPKLQDQIRNLKDTGRDYACITFPNVDNIEIQRYRVNLWSVDEKRLYQYDVFVEDGDNVTTAIEKSNLPDKCPNTGSKMLNYREAVKEGIECPSCGLALNQKRWYTNED